MIGKIRQIIPLCWSLCVASIGGASENASLPIVADGRSAYVIIHAEGAPQSVMEASGELQSCVREATGVELACLPDTQAGEGPFISIGQTRQATEAGLAADSLEEERFRIVTREGNLFILGPDTPDGGWTARGGTSTGSANGVYVFLEENLGVRWLMPGADGRDVPARREWRLPALDQSGGPGFAMRELSHLWDFASPEQTRAIQAWMRRLRLGSSVAIRWQGSHRADHWQHNWRWLTDDHALFAAHPEWFAMDASGKRWHSLNQYAKLETTNPALIRFFADRAIATLKSSERPRPFSLTPNDAPSRWSESPESKAWYDPAIGEGRETAEFKPQVPSKTSLVMKWYADVAELVAKDYPQGRLTGFIYSDYLYPPVTFTGALPENLSLIFCAPNYGYELGQEPARQRLTRLLEAWSQRARGELYYYDIPSLLLRQEDSDARANFPGTTALITPAAPETLDFLFSTLQRFRLKGAYLYGAASWSNAALANYLVARLLWAPEENALALQKEWLARAYGPKAGARMEVFYHRLDALYQKFGYIGYNLTAEMLRRIYAESITELETLLEAALAEPMTPVQTRRLEALTRKLIALQWRLKNMKLLAADYRSSFTRSQSEVIALLLDSSGDTPAFPGILPPGSAFQREEAFANVSLRAELPETKAPRLHANTWAVLYSTKVQRVTLLPRRVDHGASVATYEIRDAGGTTLARGILAEGETVSFSAEAGQSYFLLMPPRSRRSAHPTRCELVIPGAALGQLREEADAVILRETGATLYAWSDKGSPQATEEGVMLRK